MIPMSYLPPLMIYAAAGIKGLTAIVGAFFVKDYLGLSAPFLLGLEFWAGVPWILKMPLGHCVDLMWRWKAILVYVGAGFFVASFLIMYGLLEHSAEMLELLPANVWFVIATLLAPVGYVLQDVVADAMTVEAVPLVDDDGHPFDELSTKLMHTTVQTLGRVAVLGGGLLVGIVTLFMLSDIAAMSETQKSATYGKVYLLAMLIPAVSITGLIVAAIDRRRRAARLRNAGLGDREVEELLFHVEAGPAPNWWILGGGALYLVFMISIGIGDVELGREIIFAGSLLIVVLLMFQLFQRLDLAARRALIGSSIVIFGFRVVPLPGPGAIWWQIDVLGFDEAFFSVLMFVSSGTALVFVFVLRKQLVERSLVHVVCVVTILSSLLLVPFVAMSFGFHEWLLQVTNGQVGPRLFGVVNAAFESPLQQIAMIPVLAWIAQNAPSDLKATFFAVIGSFANLAVSGGQLISKHLNSVFVITRQVVDGITGETIVAADYHSLAPLLISVALITLAVPLLTVFLVQRSRYHTDQ